jgi:hypothetical protein
MDAIDPAGGIVKPFRQTLRFLVVLAYTAGLLAVAQHSHAGDCRHERTPCAFCSFMPSVPETAPVEGPAREMPRSRVIIPGRAPAALRPENLLPYSTGPPRSL